MMQGRDITTIPANLVLFVLIVAVGFWLHNTQSVRHRAEVASQRRTTRQICRAVNNLNRAITVSLLRSKRNLPRLSYYRTHKKELRLVQVEIRRELKTFRPRTCK